MREGGRSAPHRTNPPVCLWNVCGLRAMMEEKKTPKSLYAAVS